MRTLTEFQLNTLRLAKEALAIDEAALLIEAPTGAQLLELKALEDRRLISAETNMSTGAIAVTPFGAMHRAKLKRFFPSQTT